MTDKTYKEYIEEIEELKIKYNLKSNQILMLQIAAAVKVDNLDYDRLKEEFMNGTKKN